MDKKNKSIDICTNTNTMKKEQNNAHFCLTYREERNVKILHSLDKINSMVIDVKRISIDSWHFSLINKDKKIFFRRIHHENKRYR